jgi:general secretion pathway protein C
MRFLKTIEKNIWPVNLVLLFLVAYFSAGLVNFYLGKKFILAPGFKAPQNMEAPAQVSFSYHPSSSKIIERNLFGNVPEVSTQNGEASPIVNVDAELIGVIYFSNGSKLNSATIKVKQDNKTDIFKIGDEVISGAVLSEIKQRSVTITLSNKRTQELFFLFGEEPPVLGADPEAARLHSGFDGMSPEERDRLDAERRKSLGLDGKIQRVSDTYYKIERSGLESAMANLNEVVTQARMVPNFVQDGGTRKVEGFRVFKIIPGGLFEKLGMRNGDVIKTINGANMDSIEKGFELMKQLPYAKTFQIELLRGSAPVPMSYEIVD